MFGVNEDRYWMQVQARVEHWYDEDDEWGDVVDDFHEDDFAEWENADMACEEQRLERNRRL